MLPENESKIDADLTVCIARKENISEHHNKPANGIKIKFNPQKSQRNNK
jgi:hypothetical protein